MPVSVIVPNFNNERFIERSLLSVADDPAVHEIIFYDDCSTDRSVEIAASLNLPKLRVIRGTTNKGARHARDVATNQSACDVLFFLDGDDYVSEGAVGLAHEELVKREADVALFNLIRVDSTAKDILWKIEVEGLTLNGRDAFEMTLGGWRMHTVGLVRRTVYYAARRRFQPHGFSDDEILSRLIFLSSRTICGSQASYFYRAVAKPVSAESVLGLARNRLKTITLATEEGLRSTGLRDERNMVVRNLAGIVYKSLTGRLEPSEAIRILSEYRNVRAPWSWGDFKYLPVAGALRVMSYFAGLAAKG